MKQTKGTVFYLERQPIYDTVKPYFCYISPQVLSGNPITNQKYEEISVDVKDVRSSATKFTLDQNGFEIEEHQLSDDYDFDRLQQDEKLILQYGQDMENFLKKKLGVKKVIMFDHEVGAISSHIYFRVANLP
jgi:aconitase B